MSFGKVTLNGQDFPAAVFGANADAGTVDVVVFGWNDNPAAIVKDVPHANEVDDLTNVLVFEFTQVEVATPAADVSATDTTSASASDSATVDTVAATV